MKNFSKLAALLQAHTVWFQLSMMGYHCIIDCGCSSSTPNVDVGVFCDDSYTCDLLYKTIQNLRRDGDTIEIHEHTSESGLKGCWISYTCKF